MVLLLYLKLVFERGGKKEKDHRKDIRFINETGDEFRDFIRADSCQNSSLCLLGIGFYVIRVETRCIHLARRAPRRNESALTRTLLFAFRRMFGYFAQGI